MADTTEAFLPASVPAVNRGNALQLPFPEDNTIR